MLLKHECKNFVVTQSAYQMQLIHSRLSFLDSLCCSLALERFLLSVNLCLGERNDTISKRRSNFLQSLVCCLWEVEVRNYKEEERAAHEHIVIVLFDGCESAWASLGNCSGSQYQVNKTTDGGHLLPTLTMK